MATPEQHVVADPTGWQAIIASAIAALGGGEAIRRRIRNGREKRNDMQCVVDAIGRLEATIKEEQTTTRNRFDAVMQSQTQTLSNLIMATRE